MFLPKYKDAIKEVEISLYTDFWTKLENAIQNQGYLIVKESLMAINMLWIRITYVNIMKVIIVNISL